ncbi:MAG: type II secretion system protein [Pseudomonadota bacterium]|nr:type II secretion system protein [Pseudomonadota bacterium]
MTKYKIDKQSGFTLIELAVVLVIVGLIIAGVLKGQELIRSARVTNFHNSMDGFRVAAETYLDRYRVLPGDDPNASTTFGQEADAYDGDGDGLIEGDYNVASADNDSRRFWAHLRASGLITGGATDTLQPANPFGGIFGVHDDAEYGLAGPLLCASGISGTNAKIIDSKYDDGTPDAGSIRAGLQSATDNNVPSAAATAFVDTNNYIICEALQ